MQGYFLRLQWICILFSLSILNACAVIDKVFGTDQAEAPAGNGDDILQFIALGDTGTGEEMQYKVAAAIKKKCETSGCDMVLLLGDNIYMDGVSSDNDSQFQSKFELPYQYIDLPFYAVLGNHDYGGNGAGFEIEKSLHQVEYSKHSKKWKMPKRFYMIHTHNVSFFALDTNAQLFGHDDSQKETVTKWLVEDDSLWRIAFGHHPYKSNGPHGNAGSYEGLANIPIVSGEKVKDFAEAVWCGKVDIYLSGHDHSRQWLDSDCNSTKLVVSGAGAKTTQLSERNPYLFQADTPGFLYVSISGDALTAEFLNADAEVEFSWQLHK